LEESKQSQMLLKKSNDQLEKIVDDSLSGYWEWNIKENTEYLSPNLKRMFGYEDDELPNLPDTLQKLVFEEDSQSW
jgi:PAS domain-containing protein